MIIQPQTTGPCVVDVTYRDLNGAETTPTISDGHTMRRIMNGHHQGFHTPSAQELQHPTKESYFVSARLIINTHTVYYTSDPRDLPKLVQLADAINTAFENLPSTDTYPPDPPQPGDHWYRSANGALRRSYKYDTTREGEL